jgi:hypothetical protein
LTAKIVCQYYVQINLLNSLKEARTAKLPPVLEILKASQVDEFGKALRKLLLTKDSSLIKRYLQLMVEEVVIEDDEALISGSHVALAQALSNMKISVCNQVPTFICDWRAQHYEFGHWKLRQALHS